MLQVRGDPNFREKSLGAEYSGELLIQNLEGDGSVVFQIARQVDGGHATAPDFPFYCIATREGRAQRFKYAHATTLAE